MFRLKSGQECLMPLVTGFSLSFADMRVRDELVNLLSRNMAQVEVFILQIKFPSLYLPGQCDVKIGQVRVVSLQDEAMIVESVLEILNTTW